VVVTIGFQTIDCGSPLSIREFSVKGGNDGDLEFGVVDNCFHQKIHLLYFFEKEGLEDGGRVGVFGVGCNGMGRVELWVEGTPGS